MPEVPSKEQEMRDQTYETILKEFQSRGIKMTMGDAARLRKILSECKAYNKKAKAERAWETVGVESEARGRWILETFGDGAFDQTKSITDRFIEMIDNGTKEDDARAWREGEFKKMFTFLEKKRLEQQEKDELSGEAFSVPHT